MADQVITIITMIVLLAGTSIVVWFLVLRFFCPISVNNTMLVGLPP